MGTTMTNLHSLLLAVLTLWRSSLVRAQSSCPTILRPSYNAPVVGSGWTAQLVVQNLSDPRGILFDSAGNLLVVEQGKGITRVSFDDRGGTCLVVNGTQTVVDDTGLNHGIQLSADGGTLYASTSNEVYRWPYNAADGTVGTSETLVTNMDNTDHTSRTLLLSQKANGTLLVSRGSAENLDTTAQQLDSGVSQIKAFDINNLPSGRPYDYVNEGTLMGWGLRNSVGVAEHPVTGGIFSVENSADQIDRSGTDIHQDNPGEELNFHGFLNGSTEDQGGNYGYPDCFAVWGTDGFPDLGNMTTGSQFVLNPSDTLNDTTCAQNYVAPRLTFQAHTAPLDIRFNNEGTTAYVTFHGSWDRNDPVGYKLSTIAFANGQPTSSADSTNATADILSNADLSSCPDGCFRPVGLAWDGQGRLFMTSDSTGEVYVLQQAEVTATGGGEGGSSTTSAPGTLVTGNNSGTNANLAPRSTRNRPDGESIWLAGLAVALSVVGGAFFTMA